MSKPKGRIIRGSEIRTGDTLMQPTVHSDSIVTHAKSIPTGILTTLANGSTVEIPHDAKVRVHRNTRKPKDETVPELVFTSASK